jgi:hypothetical protein
MAGADVFHFAIGIEPPVMYRAVIITKRLANVFGMKTNVRKPPSSLLIFSRSRHYDKTPDMPTDSSTLSKNADAIYIVT